MTYWSYAILVDATVGGIAGLNSNPVAVLS
jgi:hypothetical protein